MNWYLDVLKKYAVFDGRARRTEYWMFALINLLIYIAIGMVEGVIGTMGVIGSIYALAVLLPSLGVAVRRLHDIDRSGWWMLLIFLPGIGAIILLIMALIDSTPGDNEYGPNPKGVAGPAIEPPAEA